MLDPIATVREWSFLSNPRVPAGVRDSLRPAELPLDSSGPWSGLAKLPAMSAAKVLNITSSLVGVDLTAADSPVLSRDAKGAFSSKFGRVGGHWCCAPTDETKRGAPRSAHFSLMK